MEADLIFVFIMTYAAIVFTATALSFTIYFGDKDEFLVPNINYIYRHSKMNLFGCILVAILIVIINPICSILWSIYHFIYFITHVGRKD